MASPPPHILWQEAGDSAPPVRGARQRGQDSLPGRGPYLFTPPSVCRFCALFPWGVRRALRFLIRARALGRTGTGPLSQGARTELGGRWHPEIPVEPEPSSAPRAGVGEAIHLRFLFTLNCSAKQTHYLGTRIKSHSLDFNRPFSSICVLLQVITPVITCRHLR